MVISAISPTADIPTAPARQRPTGPARPRLPSGAALAAPLTMAHQRLLPTLPGVHELLPDGGLRRGSSVAVAGAGATSLALALAAGPSAAGSWCAVVGAPPLGLVAASELGVALERFPLIAATGRSWARALSVALEAFDMVLAWPVRGVSSGEARRLASLGRERGTVLLLCGGGWPERPDLRLEAIRSEWLGLTDGHGRLVARRLHVRIQGRGSASVPRHRTLWLPGPDGLIAPVPAMENERTPAATPDLSRATG
jgi:hypothetical protein